MSEPGSRLWVALVHHPVRDRDGQTVTTSVTNLDVHDLARSGRTYGIAGLFIVTPIDAQRAIVERIVGYWNEPAHAARTPGRPESLALVQPVASIDEALSRMPEEPEIIGTTARAGDDRVTFAALRDRLVHDPQRTRLILLGTGWGLADEAMARCDTVLEPVCGPTDYNHLSVRSAGAILLDRLLGPDQRARK